MELLLPKTARDFNIFIVDNLSKRIALRNLYQQMGKPEIEWRRDMFYFIREAVDPDTGLPAYTDPELLEASLLLVAGAEPLTVSLSGIFFYLSGDPERCDELVDESAGVTKEKVARMKTNLAPFLPGPGSCAGKNMAQVELLVTVAKTLHRLEIRRAPGSPSGSGKAEPGRGAEDGNDLHVHDAFISTVRGPQVQTRARVWPRPG